MSNIIKVTAEELVSSDFMGEHCSCIFDADSSIQLKPNFYKIICWYENENSYACRVIDSIFFSEKQFFNLEFPSKVSKVRLKYVCKRDEILQTDSNKLQTSVAVHCDFGKVSNTSSETHASNSHKSKFSPRQTHIKKPVQSGSFPVCKKPVDPECFKIWDDNEITKPALRQNRGSFFQTFSPPILKQISNCANTHERLANVKKEFSKMVNITEDLLKKTHSSQTQKKVLGKNEIKLNVVTSLVDKNKPDDPHADPCGDFEDIKINQHQNNSSRKENLNKLSAAPKLNQIKEPNEEIDLCGDFKDNLQSDINSTVEVKSTIFDDELKPIQFSKSLQKIKTKEELICFNVDKNEPESIINNQIEIEELENECFKMTRADYDCGDKVSNDIDFHERLADTVVNTLIDSFHQLTETQCTFQVHCVSLATNENTFIENVPKTDQNDTKQPLKIDSDTSTESEIVSESLKFENNLSLCKQFKSFVNVKLIDEELKKRNIVLVDYPFIAEIDSKVVTTNQAPEIKPTTQSQKEVLCKEMFEELDDGFPSKTAISSEEKFRYARSKNVSIPTNNEDIYDKLDSASGSDSNNSFDVHDKKSQIIQIADLTSSLEDLERLDKICRIIEISDELSDKLFSPLNNTSVSSLQMKKWSFKDLCDRIQLDEFCNKVFGHVTM